MRDLIRFKENNINVLGFWENIHFDKLVIAS